MEYKLLTSSNKDINRLIEYKKRTIYEYAKDLSNEEIDKINKYVTSEVPKLINDYGKLLDEIYLEEEYRDKGIGTKIIKNILNNNDIVYLWVYKENKKAISLYKKLEFYAIEETESRYYMRYSKGVNSTKWKYQLVSGSCEKILLNSWK